jgi:hypothetical protein
VDAAGNKLAIFGGVGTLFYGFIQSIDWVAVTGVSAVLIGIIINIVTTRIRLAREKELHLAQLEALQKGRVYIDK